MDTRPKKNNVNKLIIMIIAVLLVIVLVLIAVIVYNQMLGGSSGSNQPDGAQMAATEVVTFTPVPTIEPAPVVTVPVVDTPTPTPEVTFTPIAIDEGDVVWVNLSYLNIRAQPDFSYDRITSIPYGTRVTGEIEGMWMFTSWNGTEGYIYIGEVKNSDKPCVVHNPGDLWPEE